MNADLVNPNHRSHIAVAKQGPNHRKEKTLKRCYRISILAILAVQSTFAWAEPSDEDREACRKSAREMARGILYNPGAMNSSYDLGSTERESLLYNYMVHAAQLNKSRSEKELATLGYSRCLSLY